MTDTATWRPVYIEDVDVEAATVATVSREGAIVWATPQGKKIRVWRLIRT